MRVLVITNLYPPGIQGGYELGCSHVVEALRRRGHDVRVLTSRGEHAENAVRILNVHRVFDPGHMSSVDPAARRALEVRARVLDGENLASLDRELTDFAPDVVYLWNLLGIGGLSLLGLLGARGFPWVWHLMDAVPRHLCSVGESTNGQLSDALARSVPGRHLACSAHVLAEIWTGGIELPGPVDLVPNWVTGEIAARRTSFFSEGTLRIVCAVGVLIEHKGIDVLIDACAQLNASDPGRFRLDLFGAELDGRFRERAAQAGLGEAVSFCGLVEQAELGRRLSQYDVFAFPTSSREPFAFAPLEAAAAGCVPIISATSGNAEWMVGGVHCLKAPRNASAFAEVLLAIGRGKIDLAPIARRGQSLVREAFHLPVVLPFIDRTLEQAAGQPGTRSEDSLLRAAVSASRALLA